MFFKDHAHARACRGRIKKRAFCRKTQPVWLGFALRLIGKVKRILLPPGERQAAGLMGAG